MTQRKMETLSELMNRLAERAKSEKSIAAAFWDDAKIPVWVLDIERISKAVAELTEFVKGYVVEPHKWGRYQEAIDLLARLDKDER